jgi:hypothetical protein
MSNIVNSTGDPPYYNYWPTPMPTPHIVNTTIPVYYPYPYSNVSEMNLLSLLLQNMQKQLDEMQATIKELQDKLNDKV